jgi:hypothetical protein
VLATNGELIVKFVAVKSVTLLVAGFVAGIAATSLLASASPATNTVDPSKLTFQVSIDEIKQNFVFGDEFSGSYKKTVTMSDGSVRKIALRPMLRPDGLWVEFKDTGGLTYMSPNGTTTNGKLMVQLRVKDIP